tara:strand:+ start:255 stop:476 length:222 start_codon:yes stop_codon:yes gene_type:complete
MKTKYMVKRVNKDFFIVKGVDEKKKEYRAPVLCCFGRGHLVDSAASTSTHFEIAGSPLPHIGEREEYTPTQAL